MVNRYTGKEQRLALLALFTQTPDNFAQRIDIAWRSLFAWRKVASAPTSLLGIRNTCKRRVKSAAGGAQ